LIGIGCQRDDWIKPVGVAGATQHLFDPLLGNAQQLGHLRDRFIPDRVKAAGHNTMVINSPFTAKPWPLRSMISPRIGSILGPGLCPSGPCRGKSVPPTS
jgi:hypothetical protein